MFTRIKKSLVLCLVAALTFIINGCGDDDNETPTGSLFVTVKTQNGQVVEGAQVRTNPNTLSTTTDQLGTTFLEDIPTGVYTVDATLNSFGSGTISATVLPDQSTNVEVELVFGVFVNPQVFITSPTLNEVFDVDGEIMVTGSTRDDMDEATQLEVVLKMGESTLGSTNPESDGSFQFNIENPGIGIHTLVVEVEDTDERIGSSSVIFEVADLPDPVTLNAIEKTSASNILNWSRSDLSNFASYNIYKTGSFSNNTLVATISSQETTTYEDQDIQLGRTYTYQIGVIDSDGREALSNEESIEAGIGIRTDAQIVRMLNDEDRGLIYALDASRNQLLFIDYGNETVNRINVGSAPSDLTLNASGDELFIANFGSSIITVVNPDTKSVKRQITVNTTAGTWDGNPYRIEWLAGDYLVYTSEDQWNNLKLANAQTGELITTAASIFQPELITNADKTLLYVAESSSTGSQAFTYQVVNDQLVIIDRESERGSAARTISISADDSFIFYRRRKLSANNLSQVMGSFPETIYATNTTGTLAISETKIYNANTFTAIKDLPLFTSQMFLDQANDLLYLYDQSSTNIYQVSID